MAFSKTASEVFCLLREQYPVFTYHDFQYSLNQDKDLILSFDFRIGENIRFSPTTIIPYKEEFHYFYTSFPLSSLENIIFHIGMIELISYWKSTCSPKIIVKPAFLDENAIPFWKKIYYHGLGEFFYCNGIETDIDTFVDICSQSQKEHKKQAFPFSDQTIIPIGGGKDSIVTLELLKNTSLNNTPLIINPRKATLKTVEIGEFGNHFIEIRRKIDSNLLELNKKGFLNGHTPFSAMLAFYSVLISVLSGKKNIALSNESSANEATVKNSDVNHQYSKSIYFEADFRQYVQTYINEEVNYYSFLRPLSELQIGYLFSLFPKYFSEFKSCNVGSKTDVWCCKCPKCLFSYIILSPFIAPKVLENIFGKNLLDDPSLLPQLKELTGESDVKPFECVGTREEVCIALCEAYKHTVNPPFLLRYFAQSHLYGQYKNTDIRSVLTRLEEPHFLPEDKLLLLQKYLSKIEYK